MSTVRIAAMRLSSVAKRARNSAAASRIAAGRSPRGHVALASSNSWKGLSPIVSGLSITAMVLLSAARSSSLDCSRPPGLLPAPHLLAPSHAIAPVDDRPVPSLSAPHHVPPAAARLDPVAAPPADQPVGAALPADPVAAALSLHAVAAVAGLDAVAAAARVDGLAAVGALDPVALARADELGRAGVAASRAADAKRQ